MKPNTLATSAAALFAVMLLFILLQCFRQSAIEAELAALRSDLENAPAPRVVQGDEASGTTVFIAGERPPGTPRELTNDELLDTARQRIAELEAVLHGQADILEQLVAEAQQRKEARRKAAMRSWGEEQATGAPDTMVPGDHSTAWAPGSADGGIEWLEAEFQNETDLAKVVVRQTCNPGGIVKVAIIGPNGVETPVWQGEDPSKGQQLADTPFAIPPGTRANRVRIYVDTAKQKGWEEIDAVQITGRDGASQWARSTSASSTYAGGQRGVRRLGNLSGEYLSFEPTIERSRSTLENLSGDDRVNSAK